MEILQTIWTALTTENEVLLKYVAIPMSVLEIFTLTLLFTVILNINYTKKQFLLYVLSFSLVAILSNLLIPSPYNTLPNIVIGPILIMLIFKSNILKSILAEIIPYIIFVVLSLIIQKLFGSIFAIDTNTLLTVPIYKIPCSLAIYAIAYIIYLIARNKKLQLQLISNFKKHKAITINIIIGFIAIATQYFVLFSYINVLSNFAVFFSLFVLTMYFILNVYSLIRTKKLEVTTQKLEEEILYNKTLTILHDNIRGFKHDFNNIVQAIGGYISTNNIEALKVYYKDLLDDCQRVNNLSILNPEMINNPAIYSLLTSKYHQAAKLNIKFNITVVTDLKDLKIKTYELTRILGILLDNAIEASSLCDEKIINVEILKDKRANRDLIIIQNTYTNKDIHIDKIFEKGYTSKTVEQDSTNHGLGLWEVRKFLSKHNNLNLYTTKDKTYFKQQFEIYY